MEIGMTRQEEPKEGTNVTALTTETVMSELKKQGITNLDDLIKAAVTAQAEAEEAGLRSTTFIKTSGGTIIYVDKSDEGGAAASW